MKYILIVIALLTPSFLYPLFTYTQAHAITLLSALDQPHKLYRMYHIVLHVMINGKSIPMILDKGDDITVVTGHFVKDLQLDKLPSSQLISKLSRAPRYTDYLPTVQKMIDSLVIKNSLRTKGIVTMPDKSTNLYQDNLEKCYDGLCYVKWTRTAGENLK